MIDDGDITEGMDRILSFGQRINKQGYNFLFVLAPTNTKEETYYQDYTEKKWAEIRKCLEENRLDM